MMKFHFLNVGHGDCTFVELPSGRLMLVDINNSKSLSEEELELLAIKRGLSLSDFRRPGSYNALLNKSWEDYYEDLLVDPVDYHKEVLGGAGIFRYVQTHPDMDHMGGLHRFFYQERVSLFNFWDLDHSKTKEEQEFENTRHDYSDWLAYRLLRLGFGPNDLKSDRGSITVIKNDRFDTGSFWSEDSIEVLSPSKPLREEQNNKENWNNLSYVLRFTHGGRKVILAGDAEKEAWESILGETEGAQLDCDILKAAHHGRKSGYHEPAIDVMSPSVVIASVGKKPESDAHDDYKNKGANVFSTRANGTITVTLWDDGEVWVENSSGVRIDSLPPIGNGARMVRYA